MEVRSTVFRGGSTVFGMDDCIAWWWGVECLGLRRTMFGGEEYIVWK